MWITQVKQERKRLKGGGLRERCEDEKRNFWKDKQLLEASKERLSRSANSRQQLRGTEKDGGLSLYLRYSLNLRPRVASGEADKALAASFKPQGILSPS